MKKALFAFVLFLAGIIHIHMTHATFDDFPNHFDVRLMRVAIKDKVGDALLTDATREIRQSLDALKDIEVQQVTAYLRDLAACNDKNKAYELENDYTLCKASCLNTWLIKTKALHESVISLMLNHATIASNDNRPLSKKIVGNYRHRSRNLQYALVSHIHMCEAKDNENLMMYYKGNAYTLCDMCKILKSNEYLEDLRQLNVSFISALATIIYLKKE